LLTGFGFHQRKLFCLIINGKSHRDRRFKRAGRFAGHHPGKRSHGAAHATGQRNAFLRQMLAGLVPHRMAAHFDIAHFNILLCFHHRSPYFSSGGLTPRKVK
jgi:hypothetical protein